ncbi:tyrosine-protein phosphatase [Sporohalobacter salinus]|uniref:tyrosine-protein phosphatase n=1 Tax=Sporohalobacter salinus TaxID=1494606 RepID=UPI00195F3459|nr:CpsB/CapC family capsule biosynthesis tyrosine phosphatase [Sporohalobacter salinus]MBM7622989.1 protein-tyrosine phosphatase [Sporohalobacter salinus]
MIDVHTHILPGVDDGLKSKREVLKVATKAFNQGIKKIVATPHYLPGKDNLSFSEIKDKVFHLQKFLEEKGFNLVLLPGVEVYITPNVIKQVQQGIIKGLNNSRYILVELPLYRIPDYTDDIFFDLQVLGYTPIIAHPERYKRVRQDPNLLYHWINEGMLAQLDAGSLLGRFGSQVKKTAEILVRHNMVQLIGSDLHSTNQRDECLPEAMNYLKKLIGEQVNEYIRNAQLVINNQELRVSQPKYYKKRKGFLGGLI